MYSAELCVELAMSVFQILRLNHQPGNYLRGNPLQVAGTSTYIPCATISAAKKPRGDGRATTIANASSAQVETNLPTPIASSFDGDRCCDRRQAKYIAGTSTQPPPKTAERASSNPQTRPHSVATPRVAINCAVTIRYESGN